MIPTSIIEKLKTIFNIISSSPFFFIALIIAIVLLILVIISLKKYKKVNTKLFVISWIFVVIVLIIKYHAFIINLIDSFIENIFMAIYFPNFAVFTIVLLITNISLFHSVLKKDQDMIYKIIQSISAILIDFLFILILDTTAKNNIDIYSQTEVYQNNDLFVLLESSMAIFTVDVALNTIVFIIKKLLNHNKLPQENNIPQEQNSIPIVQQPVVEESKPNIPVVNTPSIQPTTPTYMNNITTNQINPSIMNHNNTVNKQSPNIYNNNMVTNQYKTENIPEVNIVPAVNNVNKSNNNFVINNNVANNQSYYSNVTQQPRATINVQTINNSNSILDTSAQLNNVPKQNEFMTMNNITQTPTMSAPSILNNNFQPANNTQQNINQQPQNLTNLNNNSNANIFIQPNNQNNNIEHL